MPEHATFDALPYTERLVHCERPENAGGPTPVNKLQKNPAKPVPEHPSFCEELYILSRAVEGASPDDNPNALRNWEALVPEERWWLYTMTVATTGQAMQKGLGLRKALRDAIADNPIVE